MLNEICLAMIVKNEAHVLQRCLESVYPHISSWIIVDTGSTDTTKDVALECLKDKPGEYIHHEWKGFGDARSLSLRAARKLGEYSLVIDADDILSDGYFPHMTLDGYHLDVRYNQATYGRMHVFKSSKPWYYEGHIHEYAKCDEPHTYDKITTIHMRIVGGGARSKNPKKFQDDAKVLERLCDREPLNTRYRFYLAQSYRDCQYWAHAKYNYEKRATMGGWPEEVFYSLFEAARMTEKMNKPFDEVYAAYMVAWNYRPIRAEPLWELARYCAANGKQDLADKFVARACTIPRPADTLFVNETAYRC